MADGMSGYTTPRHFQRSARPSISGSPLPSSSSSPLVRAQWPWSNTLQYVQRPSSAMSSQAPSTINQWEASSSTSSSVNTQSQWTATPRNAAVPPALQVTPEYEDHGIRQWTFSAFEWTVPNVRDLKKFVENQGVVIAPASTHSDDSHTGHSSGKLPAVLRETPVVDGKFKLEICLASSADEGTTTSIVTTETNEDGNTEPIRIPVNPQATSVSSPTTLSLCLTSLQLDYDQSCEIGTTIMAGIKSSADFAGQRGARTEWVWEFWEDFVFRKGSEFWECNLPALSQLLENPRISAGDSFTISIQLHTPVGPHFPQQPAAYYVPKDLLDGLEASLDNSNTGDVQFVCLERCDPPAHPGSESLAGPMPPPNASTSSSGSPSPMARKRVIYAHADILTRRSEYFATLISSSFRESILDRERGRTMHTIVVEEADFVTVYWLLKYLYCDWLLFREDEDPRAAVDGIGAGWSARWLSQGSEWEWKTFSGKTGQFEDSVDEESTTKSVTSESVSAGSIISDGSRTSKTIGLAPPVSPTTNRTPSRSSTSTSLRPTASQATASRRPGKLPVITTNIPAPTVTARSPSSSRSSPPQQQQHAHFYSSQARVQSGRHQPDPHEHPTTTPPAASALCVYQLAHRYRIPGLQQLALEHMMSSLTARGAFPLLLATCFWAELNGMVQDFIVEHWPEVSGTVDFEQCCLEVAAGEWGPEGGKTLAALFRRLHSPAARFTGA